jgi:DNA-binding CsgD family transcriptional regulator
MPPAPGLNERDLELVAHLADGMSTGRISEVMSVTSNTTRTRIRRIQRKLAAPHREQVVAEARHLGML